MTIQSIRRTPVPGAPPAVDHRKYAEVWPELRLNLPAAERHMSSIAGGITIAMVDSGVPGEFPGPANAQDRDDDGHAALLARTIHCPARTRSPLNIDIRATKAFSAQGWPKPEGGAPAIEQGTAATPRVIVLAWDVGHTTDRLRAAILAVRDTAVVVVAAGNWSLDNDKHPNWPANYGGEMDHVITVMATDEHDERASFSSYGQENVYIAAPGFAKVDAAPPASPLRNFGSLRGSYSEFRGTSAATAHVALLAALVRAKHPGWSPQQVKQHIGDTARPVPGLTKRSLTGAQTKLCVTGAIADFGKALK